MADDTIEPAAPAKPAPRRRTPRAVTPHGDAASSPEASKTGDDAEPASVKRTRKPATPRAVAAPAPSKPAPKPRSSKRATPRPTRRPKEASTPPAAVVAETARDNWSKAVAVGGLAAVGALVTAALLSLGGSTPMPKGDGSDQQA